MLLVKSWALFFSPDLWLHYFSNTLRLHQRHWNSALQYATDIGEKTQFLIRWERWWRNPTMICIHQASFTTSLTKEQNLSIILLICSSPKSHLLYKVNQEAVLSTMFVRFSINSFFFYECDFQVMLVKLKLLGSVWYNTSQVLQSYILRVHLYVLCRLFQCVKLYTVCWEENLPGVSGEMTCG
jgi:hypothetical protein